MNDFFSIPVTSIDGAPDLLGSLRGKVILAVNVASRCGYTPQYAGLEQLQRDLKRGSLQRGWISLQSVRSAGARQRSGDHAVLPDHLRRHLPDERQARRQRAAASPALQLFLPQRRTAFRGTSAGISRNSSSAVTGGC